MKQIAYTLLLLTFLAAPALAAEEQNHCHDEASWAEWHALLANHQDDDQLYGLYAMRRGLCGMVEAGTIEEERATRIFEAAREELAGRWIEENKLKRPEM